MKEKRKYILIALIVGMTVFIWSNSMLPRTESAQMSGGLMVWLENTLGLRIPEVVIRKAGHFCEYAALGFLYGLQFRRGRKNGQWIYNYTMAGLATAVADESIQILSGRAPMVVDILLDLCGFTAGFGGILLLVWLLQRCKRG